MVVIRCDRSIASRLPSAAQFSAQSMTKGSLSSLRDCPGTLVFSRRPVVLEGVGASNNDRKESRSFRLTR